VSLISLVRSVIAKHPAAHPHKVAQLVAEATEADDLHSYYVTALERIVADQVRFDRNATLNSKQRKSSKLDRRQSWWARVLRERVYVGESTWKPLGDCTVDDLDFCITERQTQIGALQGQIIKYEAIRDAMLANNADTAGDLPEGAVDL